VDERYYDLLSAYPGCRIPVPVGSVSEDEAIRFLVASIQNSKRFNLSPRELEHYSDLPFRIASLGWERLDEMRKSQVVGMVWWSCEWIELRERRVVNRGRVSSSKNENRCRSAVE